MENINQNETTSQTQSEQILKAYHQQNDYRAKRKTCCRIQIGGLI